MGLLLRLLNQKNVLFFGHFQQAAMKYCKRIRDRIRVLRATPTMPPVVPSNLENYVNENDNLEKTFVFPVQKGQAKKSNLL
ncbi:16506_t:CDS:2 [Funneliformis mosseae]|uniref:16506_t:CDS:1 n=1 Tax=Funneliformis mosseae TaxID=27381 RepID=A0A9N9DBF3_FUNMO|nr:16506_t:CDS:2 [Funneliformis mosseae]